MDEKTLLFIKEHENDNVKELALQSKRYPDIDVHFAIQQIAGRQITRNKIPFWYSFDQIIYPKHISLEQSSSEKTAKYKANLCEGNSLTDLTGGMGIDFSFMSQKFHQATYIEKQEELAKTAEHNFKILRLKNVTVKIDSAEEYLKNMSTVDTIYIDPARRSQSGSKTVLISDCSPDLTEIESLIEEKSSRAIIKLSPMLDISQALKSLHNITEVHIVSVSNECKELLFIKNNQSDTNHKIAFHCVNIHNDETISEYIFDKEIEKDIEIKYTNLIKKYIYEPNASIIKAGAYKSISNSFNVKKLHPNSHLYTSDVLVKDFPGRSFTVKGVLPFNKKEIKNITSNYTQANITVRNFPLTVAEIRKKTRVKDGGNIYIFATTLFDNQKVLIVGEKS